MEGVTVSATTCNACSNKCGMHVYSKNGRLWKVKGEELHPYSRGTLCARGHGYATIGYTDARVKEPLKRVGDMEFEPISWDQAYKEIGDKIKEIIASDGPGAIALTQDPRPSGGFYTKRFMDALGSPNHYTHGAACNLACTSAYAKTLGGTPGIDLAEAECVMFIGRSYADGVRPSAAKALAEAAERGTKIIMVDPRFNATSHMATEWVPIRPGTDLALVLAMCNVVVNEELYNKKFVEEKTVGLEQFKDGIKEYTPKWAEELTTIPAARIEEIARTMAKHAPKSSIEASWRAVVGCSYQNSFECARAMQNFNALLGCFGQPGGQFWGISPKFGPLEGPKFKELPKIPETLVKYGMKEFPFAAKAMGPCTYLGKGAEAGDIKAIIFYNSNALMGYANYDQFKEALNNLELMVAIDIQMSETAINSDYILPDTTFMERKEVPASVGGKAPVVEIRLQGVDPILPDARPVDRIFTELAEACGIGEYFTFTVDDVIDAQLAPFDNADEIKENGIGKVMEGEFKFPGDDFKFSTPDGMFHFYDEQFEQIGLKPVISWVEPLMIPDHENGEFRLIGGKQAIHTHTQTTNVPLLIQITKDYGLERAWLNAGKAKELGIEDGDTIAIKSDLTTTNVRVFVTERLHPDCVYIPTGYGVKSPYLKAGQGLGIASMDHTPYHFSPYDGSTMSQENIVTIEKVEA